MAETLKVLSTAYRKSGRAMEGVLFRPFRLSRWLKLGFLTLLEQLPLAGIIIFSYLGVLVPHLHLLQEHAVLLPSLLFILPLLTLFGLFFQLLFFYLSSRAAFAYLQMPLKMDDSVWNSMLPFARAGAGYFLWRMAFWILGSLSSVLLLGVPMIFLSSAWSTIAWTGGGTLGLIALAFFLVLGFIALLTRDFVVPLMWAHGLPVLKAWDALLGLLGRNPLHFVLFYLVRLAVGLLVVLGLLTMGFLSCCLFFVVILIPGIGQAVLQPVFLFFRFFPLAILEELDPGARFLP